MEYPVLVVCQSNDGSQFLPEDWFSYELVTSLRNARKKMRHMKPALVILCVGTEEDISLAEDVAGYIRQGLSNQDSRMVLLHEASLQIDEVAWLEQHQINACLSTSPAKTMFNRSVFKREIETFHHIESNNQQHEAETELLICITRFSRAEENINVLLASFSASLSKLCHAACSFEIYIESHSRIQVRAPDSVPREWLSTMQSLAAVDSLSPCIAQAIDEQNPQINLLQQDTGIEALTRQVPEEIGSYLTFPIVVYNKVVCVLFYLIPEKEMSRVSMKQINIINKAAEQLTILLERKRAETSLKKQYNRLKDTLLELKSTKQALEHNEKLASIGRMAAGIAHEINNPLSFVMSNIASMDEYLNNIMQLQAMQSELLLSIDIQQNQKASALHQNISQFEEQAGIPFILEDIRAVVSDSFNGLQRVKNIITDLRSFSHNHQTEKTECDISTVLDETLKMVRYDLPDTVTIKQDVSFDKVFYSHAGLMEQVLINLIKNAVQALSEAETDNPQIMIKVTEENAHLMVTVEDNGPGMSEQTKAKIYEPFFTTKKIGDGTGLGLSVVYNIVQRLEGTIECDSVLGSHTRFVLRFPLKAEDGQ